MEPEFPALNGLHIAILASDGVEQSELADPMRALEQSGAIVKLVSDRYDQVRAVQGNRPGDGFPVDLTLDEADPKDFDALLLPGGADSAERLRGLDKARQFVQEMQEDGKPIASICHGVRLLVAAGLVNGRTLTGWPGLQDEIRNGGGHWLDEEAVCDDNWVSSRTSNDLPVFMQRMTECMADMMRAHLRGTADENAVGIASS